MLHYGTLRLCLPFIITHASQIQHVKQAQWVAHLVKHHFKAIDPKLVMRSHWKGQTTPMPYLAKEGYAKQRGNSSLEWQLVYRIYLRNEHTFFSWKKSMESKVGGAFIMRGTIYANFFRKSTKCGNRKKKEKKVRSLLCWTSLTVLSSASCPCAARTLYQSISWLSFLAIV